MRLLTICIVLFYNLSSFAQLPDYPVNNLEPVKLTVTYSLQYQPDSLPPHFTRQEDQVLFIGDNVSMYLSHNAYVFEKKMRQLNNAAELQEYLYTKPAMPHNLNRLYKNYPERKMTFSDWVSPNNLKYDEDINIFSWQLTGDTTSIKEYKAHKATCNFGGRNWIAWFCPDIPYNNGPYKFNGLPGLILNIRDTRNHYVFELLSIEKPMEEIMIEYLEKDFIETTKQDYFKAKDAFNANLVSWAKEGGAGKEAQQNAARISIEKNNPIELKRK